MSTRTLKVSNNKSTSRLLTSILPNHFKMVYDKESNGYKFINLLYGTEIDEARKRIDEVYHNVFLSTFDPTFGHDLYEVYLSGMPVSNYLNTTSNNIPIKITDENEFTYGSPTRLSLVSGEYDLSSTGLSGITGLEYFRDTIDGSGYFLVALDIGHTSGYLANLSGVIYKIPVDNIGNIKLDMITLPDTSNSGYPGLQTQSYDIVGSDEVLVPQDSGTLRKAYPETRTVNISGYEYQIDHYEPGPKWYVNNDTVTAYNYYDSKYYYDEEGTKLYHRTMLNNPNGSGNYTEVYITINHTPISGTLTLSDIDILDISGNAVPIPSSGKALYTLQSPYWNIPETGVFDPIYLGYNDTVPSGRGYQMIEGDTANYLKTTSWSYMNDGCGIQEVDGVPVYVNGTGTITNIIKITNPQSRYLIEYKWVNYDKLKCITASDSNGLVKLDTLNPIYTVVNDSGNLTPIDYTFTKDPSFIENNTQSQILTFDGYQIRPGSLISQINFDLPISFNNTLTSFVTTQVGEEFIGYSNSFIPSIDSLRDYQLTCYFDSLNDNQTNTVDSSVITYTSTGSNSIYNIFFKDNYGKRLIYNDNNQYYEITSGFYDTNTFYHFSFRLNSDSTSNLLTSYDDNIDRYMIFNILSDGYFEIRSDSHTYISKTTISDNNNFQDIIVNYKEDPISSSVPTFEIFYNDGVTIGFREISMLEVTNTTFTYTGTTCQFFKNCSIDAGLLKIWKEPNE